MFVMESWLSNLLHLVLTVGFLLYLYRLSEKLND
ncbi:hypothetical protein JBW_03200 [Pelosinus fermentans JBW45]|uniref:Uncharacterized protein n=1 Tax=Pelosinus fermentans JBW45 TaxID=1192197 RepID=I9NPK2_9FIRM|nr:hypothetical protein JBW_03200 [Pelosinus fermentans JBW45]